MQFNGSPPGDRGALLRHPLLRQAGDGERDGGLPQVDEEDGQGGIVEQLDEKSRRAPTWRCGRPSSAKTSPSTPPRSRPTSWRRCRTRRWCCTRPLYVGRVPGFAIVRLDHLHHVSGPHVARDVVPVRLRRLQHVHQVVVGLDEDLVDGRVGLRPHVVVLHLAVRQQALPDVDPDRVGDLARYLGLVLHPVLLRHVELARDRRHHRLRVLRLQRQDQRDRSLDRDVEGVGQVDCVWLDLDLDVLHLAARLAEPQHEPERVPAPVRQLHRDRTVRLQLHLPIPALGVYVQLFALVFINFYSASVLFSLKRISAQPSPETPGTPQPEFDLTEGSGSQQFTLPSRPSNSVPIVGSNLLWPSVVGRAPSSSPQCSRRSSCPR